MANINHGLRNWFRYKLFVLLIFLSFPLTGQNDDVGSGRCLHLDGVDDYVELGNIYDSLYLPITISAWINLDEGDARLSPIFIRQDINDVHDELIFFVSATQIVIGYGNGVVPDIPVFRRIKGANFQGVAGRWLHVAGVIHESMDMEVFVNGINVGGFYSGNFNLPIITSRQDVARIGYWSGSGVTSRFKGMIDEVQIWNRGLTESEIRENMCRKLTGNEIGLVGNWDFNESNGTKANDKSRYHHAGELFGSPHRIFSGAPIGDVSAAIYPTTWDDEHSSLVEGLDKISFSNVQGNPEGLHLYAVKNLPSQQVGLNIARVVKPYFGVFIASLDADNTFDATVSYAGTPSLEGAARTDNSNSTWRDFLLPLTQQNQRVELIRMCEGNNIKLELGPDKIVCDQTTYTINSQNDPSVYPILWSTGESSSEITVSNSGLYVITIGTCDAKKDSVKISFYKTPTVFSLGEDIIECTFSPKLLDPNIDSADFKFTWQDGSVKRTFQASGFGTYWMSMSNDCGMVSDTLAIRQPVIDLRKIPNAITPNGDNVNELFQVEPILKDHVSLQVFNRWGEEVVYLPNYSNIWDGGSLTAGVYFLQLKGDCVNYNGALTIIR